MSKLQCLLFINNKQQAYAKKQSQEKNNINNLLAFTNKDLRSLNKEDNLLIKKNLNTLSCYKNITKKQDAYTPWFFWKMPVNQSDYQLILLEVSPIIFIPSASSVRVNVFTSSGNCLLSSVFSTGWRIDVTRASLHQNSDFGVPMLEIISSPVVGGGDISRQYYALTAEGIVLIRLQNSKGELVRNSYEYPNHFIGPLSTRNTTEEWGNDLTSGIPWKTINVSNWLAGVPKGFQLSKYSQYPKSYLANINMIKILHSKEGTRKLLENLSKSNNKWIKEVAQEALMSN
ncbi:MAG: hypothetical protein FD167_3087 [bacterium]|nr:MAG: hypothetical protein FD167_3087 [bacterium]